MLFSERAWVIATVVVLADALPHCNCGSASGKASEARGKAMITKIEVIPELSRNTCADPVRVYFDFLEDGKPGTFRHNDIQEQLMVDANSMPSRALIEQRGVRVGQLYPCIKRMYGRGSRDYYFPTLNLSANVEGCPSQLDH